MTALSITTDVSNKLVGYYAFSIRCPQSLPHFGHGGNTSISFITKRDQSVPDNPAPHWSLNRLVIAGCNLETLGFNATAWATIHRVLADVTRLQAIDVFCTTLADGMWRMVADDAVRGHMPSVGGKVSIRYVDVDDNASGEDDVVLQCLRFW